MRPNNIEYEPQVASLEDWSIVVANIDPDNLPTDAGLDQLPAFVGQARDLFPDGVATYLAQQRPPYDGTPLVHTRILS